MGDPIFRQTASFGFQLLGKYQLARLVPLKYWTVQVDKRGQWAIWIRWIWNGSLLLQAAFEFLSKIMLWGWTWFGHILTLRSSQNNLELSGTSVESTIKKAESNSPKQRFSQPTLGTQPAGKLSSPPNFGHNMLEVHLQTSPRDPRLQEDDTN